MLFPLVFFCCWEICWSIQIIEFGSTIRNGVNAKIDKSIYSRFNYSLSTYRIVVSNMTIEIDSSDYTTASYYGKKLPISTAGCLRSYFIHIKNDGEINETSIAHFENLLSSHRFSVIIIDGTFSAISQHVLDAFSKRKVVIGLFSDSRNNHYRSRLTDKLLGSGVILLKNLVRQPIPWPANFWSYLFIFDLMQKQPTSDENMTFLANLVMIRKDRRFPWCNSGNKIAVLSHTFHGEPAIYSGFDRPRIIDRSKNKISLYDHYGTHLDSANHFSEFGLTTDKLPLKYSFAPCIKVEQAAKTPNFLVSRSKFEEWEKLANRTIPDSSFVFVSTGHESYWNSPDRYMRSNRSSAAPSYPGVHTDAIKWLIQERDVLGVGIDSMSPDSGKTVYAPVHLLLANANALIFENLANLDEFPNASGSVGSSVDSNWNPIGQCLLVYLRTEAGSGAPVAIFAHITSENYRIDVMPWIELKSLASKLEPALFSLTLLLIVKNF